MVDQIQNQPIADSSLQNPYKEISVTIQPFTTETIYYVHDYFRIITYSGAANKLKVRFAASGEESDYSGAGIGYKLIQPVNRVSLRNTDSSAITVTIALAVGDISDDRLNVSGNINVIPVTNTNTVVTAATTVTTTAVMLAASSSTRKNIVIQNNDTTNDLYIGGSTVTSANGIKLSPGAIYSNNNDGSEYWGRTSTGTANTRVLTN